MKTADMVRPKYSLHGPEEDFDSRVTAYRSDLADLALAGKLFAPHYAEALPMRCTANKTLMRRLGGKNYEAVSELLHGEDFQMLDVAGDWAWGFRDADKYLGYVPVHALQKRAKTPEPTHYVSARGALIFVEPDIKSGVLKRLPMGARIACGEASECGKFLKTGKGHVHVQHVQGFDKPGTDHVEYAEQLLGAPYLWGGRSGDGLDCSGLIQTVLALVGVDAPRDSDQQMAAIGEDVPADAELKRGDIIFFPDHVGVMVDADMLIHANAFWMRVSVDPLSEVAARFDDVDEPILARKRLG